MDVGGMRNDDGMDADMRGRVKGLDDARRHGRPTTSRQGR